ncbi:MAG: hypothetical protein JWP15_2585, partial [Alphaproteobacteria bacterium]|nr:hypothetical protein [Alphaproteobacteria bacterium]
MKMRAKLSGAGGVALAALLLALVPAMAATTEKKA